MSWIDQFEELSALDSTAREFLLTRASVVALEPGQRVFAPGKKPGAFLLLLEGTVVVRQFSASGREIVLYRVSGGESCIMTTACLLSDEDYLAEGVTETPVKAVALGKADFDALMGDCAAFRRFVFSKYASRVTHLMELLERVAFERIDRRLAGTLLALADEDGVVKATHQTLAIELGTAREVVSRQLKSLVGAGLVVVERGAVRITDRNRLGELASLS